MEAEEEVEKAPWERPLAFGDNGGLGVEKEKGAVGGAQACPGKGSGGRLMQALRHRAEGHWAGLGRA